MSEFMQTQEQVRQLLNCDEQSFPPMYAYITENEYSKAELMQEVAEEFMSEKNNIELLVMGEQMNRQMRQKTQQNFRIQNVRKS